MRLNRVQAPLLKVGLTILLGSIVPLSTGMMRNRFFPQGAAVYLSFPELKDIKSQNTRIERDFEFGADLPKGKKGRKAIPEPPEEPVEEVQEVIPAAPVEVERITVRPLCVLVTSPSCSALSRRI